MNLANVVTPERKNQLTLVLRHIASKRDGQIESQAKVRFALVEAVDLLRGVAAALREKHFRQFDVGSVQRREAVALVGVADDAEQAIELNLLTGQVLGEPAWGSGFD